MSEVEVVDLLKGYEPDATPYDSLIDLCSKYIKKSGDVDEYVEASDILKTLTNKKQSYVTNKKWENFIKKQVEYMSVTNMPELGVFSDNLSYQTLKAVNNA